MMDKILTCKASSPKADTSELEAKIDKMVYELYDLSEEEIAIVEGK
ncbi:MAG: type II restriction endonuclease [Sulfurospirillaceae bacterium]|nr:type II restriction endonuclease [Sulfurospirillaceae bacterium]